MRYLVRLLHLLVLTGALMTGTESVAQSYFLSLSGPPGLLGCSFNWVAVKAVGVDWNLPSATQVRRVETVATVIVEDVVETIYVQSGSEVLGGPDGLYSQFPGVPLGYTFTYSLTPLLEGAGTTSFSFDCMPWGSHGTPLATNFRISNASPFGPPSATPPIPALDKWALSVLAAMLAGAGGLALRLRRACHQ